MVTKLFKAILGITGVMIISVSAFFFYMRYHDGPMELITGGPFQSGTIVAEDEGNTLDISALKDRSTIEFQSEEPLGQEPYGLLFTTTVFLLPAPI